MSGDTLVILLVNLLLVLFGVGLMPLLGLAATPRQLLLRLPLAFAVGIATAGVLGQALELARVPLGPIGLTILALAALAGGSAKLLREDASQGPDPARAPALSIGVGLVSLGFALALLLHAAHAYAVRPLREYDGWVIWATKARALFELGGVDGAVFANDVYDHADYPLLLPTLEAIGFRALGEFDGTALHLQLAALAFAFVGAAWTISRASSSPAVAGLATLAAVSAPAVLTQLGWNYADIQVAMLCSLGVAALAAWLQADEPWLLRAGVLFLAAAALTKSEGTMFALAAFAALLVVLVFSRRDRLRPALLGLGILVLAILPWRVYVAVNDIHPADYELSNLVDVEYLADHSNRLRPTVSELAEELAKTSNWGLLLPLVGCAFATALLRRRYAVASFGGLWLAFSFVGLLLVYWISELELEPDLFNTSYRTIATPLLGAALLVPQLVGRDSVPVGTDS
jgi:hypothetical protein